MAQYCINGKRVVKLQIPHTYDINKIQLGIPVMDNEAEIVGLKEVGDIVLPSGTFGPQSKKTLMDIHMPIKLNLKNAAMFPQTGYIHLVIPMHLWLLLIYIRSVILK